MAGFLTKYSDMALAILVVGIVGMLIIPLPTFVVDLLLTINISVAVILLLTSTYVSNVLKITSFPAILLLTTLFRLALNVSTTRLILLQADAGQVVDAFGDFVVQGNYVVGVVIFLILTIIQFVVIAKGSERVAEVAARFTLDAMPGKQMAIDADLRSGSIDLDAARCRRSDLQKESKVYGAMDGAMKFVKGDAIAGIVITLINIIAGLAIGVLMMDMPLGEAAKLYTLLTIGDGLVTQIPALLIATAAGILVTRVSDDEGSSHLGQEIGTQILDHPKAIGITAGLLLLFAVLPGMPTVPFILLAIFLGLIARSALRSRRQPPAFADDTAPSEIEELRQVRLAVLLGPELARSLDSSGGKTALRDAIGALRQAVRRQYGVQIPAVQITPGGRGLSEWGYRLELDEIPIASAEVPAGSVLADATAEQLATHQIPSEPAVQPGTGRPAVWVSVGYKASLASLGIRLWSVAEVLMLHLAGEVRKRLREFLGIQEVQALIDDLETTHPALVKAVIPRIATLPELSDVLGRLIEEGISIRNLKKILDAIAEDAAHAKNPVELTEVVRVGLKREISHLFSAGTGRISAYVVDGPIEDMIRASIRETDSGPVLSLEPVISQEILAALRAAARPTLEAGESPVFITQSDIRHYLKKLSDIKIPGTTVLSYQELLPELQITPLGKVVVGS
jgi:type III secretion protein V